MKKILSLVVTIMLLSNARSQDTDSTRAIADAAVKMFTWDIQKEEKGTLMFLDVPYQRENQDSAEFLTLTVAKNRSDQRPAFISIIIPDNINKSNGIFIEFAKTGKDKHGNWKSELEKNGVARIDFESCNAGICKARIIGGYLTDGEAKNKIDVFQKFLDFDSVLFLFVYPDGSHKSVAVPLFSFKSQYKTLQ